MNESTTYVKSEELEVEHPLVARWRKLGYCTIKELANELGISANACHARMRKATKYKVYESRMNYEKDL